VSNNDVLTIDQLDMLRRERIALSKLTDKQKAFCEMYCRTFDRVQSLRAGGYYLPNDTKKGTAQVQLIEKSFVRVMSSPAVQEYIFLLKQSVASRLNVSMDSIIDEYKNLAFTNMDDYVSWDDGGFTKVRSSEELTRAQKAGIVEITETTTKAGTTVKIKLHNKQTALDRLFDVLKELEERDTKPEGPAKVSQTQINVILQDPIKRRAIEHLAESLFTKQIKLVGTDKDRLEFDKHMTKITTRLLEATGGNRGAGGIRIPEGETSKEASGAEHNAADYQAEDTTGQETLHKGKRANERVTEESSSGSEEGELEEGRRYDIDGL
jgi:phage terminase small subunit